MLIVFFSFFLQRTLSSQRYQAVPSSTTNPLLNGVADDDEEEDEEEDASAIKADDTPWLAFFTHPVSLTLFINSWSGVSDYGI